MAPLELRRGARVRYSPSHSGETREGVIVRSSPNGEEWLVKNRYGEFWLHVRQLMGPEDVPDDAA